MLGGWTVFVSVLFFLAWLLPLLCGRGVNCVLIVLAGVLPLLGGRGVYCVWFFLAWLLPLLGCVLCAVCLKSPLITWEDDGGIWHSTAAPLLLFFRASFKGTVILENHNRE